MEDTYFVMLNHPAPDIPAVSLEEEDGDIAFFVSLQDAIIAASNSALGSTYGYEIFILGGGIL